MSKDGTIRIGAPYLTKEDDLVRLCADVTISKKTRQIWYGVDKRYEYALTTDRLDPFVAALIRIGMQTGSDIVCEAPVSGRLLYKINHSYIPALTFAFRDLKNMHVVADPADPCRSEGAIGCSCSFGADSLYTLFTNRTGEYPITHICLFNTGTFEGDTGRSDFFRQYEVVKGFAKEEGLDSLFVDTNLHEALDERYLDVYTLRQLSAVLALGGLFGTYLYSSGHIDAAFKFNPSNCASYDLLTINCFSTDSTRLFLSGSSTKRVDKIIGLAQYPMACKRLHPCINTLVGEKNCGRCLKCRRDMITIHAAGFSDRFSEAYDFTGFEKKIPVNLAFLMTASQNATELYDDTLNLWKEKGFSIPKSAYVYAEQFLSSVDRLKEHNRDQIS